MLHLFTCHGRIMPRLAELLFCGKFNTEENSTLSIGYVLLVKMFYYKNFHVLLIY